MRNPDRQTTFRFRQFEVRNDLAAMKVGTDGVLLGAWASAPETGPILDIGTGSGVIALMLAQRSPQARIDACDIDADAVAEASVNFAASPWSDRLNAVRADITADGGAFAPGVYTLAVCNPPFFSGGGLPPDPGRRTARSDSTLPPLALMQAAATLLAPTGLLTVVYPADREAELLMHATMARLQPRRICRVTTVARKPPRRVLMEFGRQPDGPCEVSDLTIHDSQGNFSADYRRLVHPFYLNI